MLRKITIIILVGLFLAQPVLASEFNPNYIISDSEILDDTTMDLADIKEFLTSKGSYLATYRTANYDDITKTAAEIIYDASLNNYDCDGVTLSDNPTQAERKLKCKPVSINPQFLLVLLQKEQSLIEESTIDKQSQLDWATGYGCPDTGGCNERWKGFGKQINSAALQFYSYIDEPQLYKYKVGETYTLTNTDKEDSVVTPANLATAALYNYTPHVYNGNYNFWKIWNRYFSRIFPDGSLAQIEGEPGVWLIQNGAKRPFLSRGALVTRYDPEKIITVKKADLDAYTRGTPIKFAQYSIVRSPMGSTYLLVDDAKRKISSPEVFRKLGFNPEEVEDVSTQDLNYYRNGKPVTENDAYPTGALLQDPDSGGVYFVINSTKAPLIDRIFLETKFKNRPIIKATAEELADYEKIKPVKLGDGYLLKKPLSPTVYVISNGLKRPIASGEVFESLGYKWGNILTVHPRVLALYDEGELLTEESLNRE